MNTLPEFAEVGERIFEVKVVPGPLSFEGRYARSLVDVDEQEILISDEVPADYRAVILEKAVSATLGLSQDAFPPIPLMNLTS